MFGTNERPGEVSVRVMCPHLECELLPFGKLGWGLHAVSIQLLINDEPSLTVYRLTAFVQATTLTDLIQKLAHRYPNTLTDLDFTL